MRRDIMPNAQVSLKTSLIKLIDEMPEARIAEVLDFALFLNTKEKKESGIELKLGSFESLKRLSGIVDLGGDAVIDSENYWE
jgi:hypothetical protein